MVQQATVRRPVERELKPEFIAAIRLKGGKRDLYRIRNACDIQDARQVVLDQLDGVVSVLVMPCFSA